MWNGSLKPVLGSQIQLGHPLAKGLVGCWLFNEGAGNKVGDASLNNNIGTITDALWTPGKFGSCLNLNGTTDYVNCGSSTVLDNLGPLTYAVWMKPYTLGGSSVGRILCKRIAENSAQGTTFKLGATNTLNFSITYNVTTLFRETSDYAIALNNWQQAVITWDGSIIATQIRIYVNGRETLYDVTTNGEGSRYTDAAYNQMIGAKTTGIFTNLFNGLIDNVMIYNRALSASEVAQLYREPFCMFRRHTIELRAAAGGGVAVKVYTRGDIAALPVDDADLETAFTDQDYTDVATDDEALVVQTATTDKYAAFLFKDKNTEQNTITIQWKGQSNLAPSDSTIYLQIYNRTTPAWETIDSDNVTGANTDLELEDQIAADLDDYFDEDFQVSCRVYQEAK